VAQDVFLRVWRHRRSFRRDSRFLTWVYTVARRAAVDEANGRRRRARSISELPEAQQARVAEEPAPPGSEATVELRDEVRRALLALPPDQWLCVIL
jgi:RNA polymerase sigma-70 factor, ECF subfamily